MAATRDPTPLRTLGTVGRAHCSVKLFLPFQGLVSLLACEPAWRVALERLHACVRQRARAEWRHWIKIQSVCGNSNPLGVHMHPENCRRVLRISGLNLKIWALWVLHEDKWQVSHLALTRSCEGGGLRGWRSAGELGGAPSCPEATGASGRKSHQEKRPRQSGLGSALRAAGLLSSLPALTIDHVDFRNRRADKNQTGTRLKERTPHSRFSLQDFYLKG